MSEQRLDERETPGLRLSISPEPIDDELAAILAALGFVSSASPPAADERGDESAWAWTGRRESLRDRDWPPQVRFWTEGRW